MDLLTTKIIPFDYVVTQALTANGTAQPTLTMQTDSKFELHAFLASASTSAATDFSPNTFSVQITDQSTGRNLSSARVPQRIITGTAYGAILERRPIIFPPNATLLFDFLELLGGTPTVTFVLKGYKLIL